MSPQPVPLPGFGALLAFIAVLALIPLALRLLRHTPLGRASPGSGALRVLSSLALGPQQRVLMLEVGSGASKRWLVVGVQPSGMQTLHVLEPGEAAPEPPTLASETAHGP